MKKSIWFCFLLLYLGINAFPQETTKLNSYVPVKRGKIILKDGTVDKFKKLNFQGQMLTYSNLNGIVIEKNISDVAKISKRSSCAGYGAMAGGVFTLAVIVVNEIDESHYQSGDGNYKVDHSEYLEAAILFVGMGALIGSFIKKYKTLYEDKVPLSLSPSLISTPDGGRYAALSLRINIR